jgi:hypothetical protein
LSAPRPRPLPSPLATRPRPSGQLFDGPGTIPPESGDRRHLLKLGLIGDEFKTARLHLLARLNGSTAWKGERRDTAAYREANG